MKSNLKLTIIVILTIFPFVAGFSDPVVLGSLRTVLIPTYLISQPMTGDIAMHTAAQDVAVFDGAKWKSVANSAKSQNFQFPDFQINNVQYPPSLTLSPGTVVLLDGEIFTSSVPVSAQLSTIAGSSVVGWNALYVVSNPASSPQFQFVKSPNFQVPDWPGIDPTIVSDLRYRYIGTFYFAGPNFSVFLIRQGNCYTTAPLQMAITDLQNWPVPPNAQAIRFQGVPVGLNQMRGPDGELLGDDTHFDYHVSGSDIELPIDVNGHFGVQVIGVNPIPTDLLYSLTGFSEDPALFLN